MNEELDKKLCEKYPKIFKDRHGSVRDTCMAWGFEHDDGWYTLIDRLCSNIQHHVDHIVTRATSDYSTALTDQEKEDFQVVALQVKEKFGGLRFYFSGGDDLINGMVQFAESMSYVICEICGHPGSVRNFIWKQTLCDSCAEQEKKVEK